MADEDYAEIKKALHNPRSRPGLRDPNRIGRGKNRDTPRVQRFIANLLADKTPRQSAIAAGYAPGSAHTMAMKLLNRPEVKAQIEEEKAKIRKAAEYSSMAAMDEAKTSMELALLTGNAMAHCKAVELRAKICGLLIERVDARLLGNFQISITGIDDKPKIVDADQMVAALCLPKSREDEFTEEEPEPSEAELMGD